MNPDLLTIPFALADMNGTVVQANAQFYLWTGTQPGSGRLSDTLPQLGPLLGTKTLGELLTEDRWVKVQGEAPGRRNKPIPVEYKLRRICVDGIDQICIEGSDLSKLREKELMLNSFSGVIDKHNRRLKMKKQALSDLLDNMRQAVFAIDSHGTIVPPSSAFTSRVFGGEVEGEHVLDTVFSEVTPGTEAASRLEGVLKNAFGENSTRWRELSVGLPTRVHYRRPDDHQGEEERQLKVACSPLFDGSGALEKILFVIDDVTEVEELARKVASEREVQARNFRRLEELISSERSAAASSLSNSARDLRKALSCFRKLQEDPGALGRLQAHLRNLDESARKSGWTEVITECDRLEHRLSALRASARTGPSLGARDIGPIDSGLTRLRSALLAYGRLAHRVMNIHDDLTGSLLSDIHQQAMILDDTLADWEEQGAGTSLAIAHTRCLANLARAGDLEDLTTRLHELLFLLGHAVDPPLEQVHEKWVECLPHLLSAMQSARRDTPLDMGPTKLKQLLVELVALEESLRCTEDAGEKSPLCVKALSELAGSSDMDSLTHLVAGLHRGATPSLRRSIESLWRHLRLVSMLEFFSLSPDQRRATSEALERLSCGAGSEETAQEQPTAVLSAARALAPGPLCATMLSRLAGTGEGSLSALFPPDAPEAPSAPNHLQRLLLIGTDGHEVALHSADDDPRSRALQAALAASPDAYPGYRARLDLLRLLQRRQDHGDAAPADMPNLVPVVARFLSGVEHQLNKPLCDYHELSESAWKLLEIPAGTVVDSLHALVDERALSQGARVQLEVHGSSTTMHRDLLEDLHGLLRAVLCHILDQPRPHREPGAGVTHAPPATLRLHFSRTLDTLKITLQDDRPGMAPTALNAQPSGPAQQRPTEGTQRPDHQPVSHPQTAHPAADRETDLMGLHMVHAKLTALGGSIAVDGVESGGSRFEIRLPARPATLDPKAQKAS